MVENLTIVACIAVHGLHGPKYRRFHLLEDVGATSPRGEGLVEGLHGPTKHSIG